MSEHVEVTWAYLVREHLHTFEMMALVGNVTDAKRQLEAIQDVIAAALKTGQLRRTPAVNISQLIEQTRPFVVLRQAAAAGTIVERALETAGVLKRELSHVTFAACPAV